MALEDPREELASIAASLRAYLEWQVDTGAGGIPRRPRQAPAAQQTPVAPAPVEPQPAPPPRAIERTMPVFEPPPVSEPPISTPPITKPPVTAPPVVAQIAAPRALDVIRAEVMSCTKCGLASTRKNTVFSRGNPEAKLCFVGEAPGQDEDEQGIPFVGRAGQLLDKMIRAMGLDPEKDVYVCNIIKCRPPANRRPETTEVETCIPYLHEQLAKVDPKVIVAMGNTAVAALLGTKQGITKVRGKWKLYAGKIPVMPTYHPSYLLREDRPNHLESKREVWEDLQAVMKDLGLQKKPR